MDRYEKIFRGRPVKDFDFKEILYAKKNGVSNHPQPSQVVVRTLPGGTYPPPKPPGSCGWKPLCRQTDWRYQEKWKKTGPKGRRHT